MKSQIQRREFVTLSELGPDIKVQIRYSERAKRIAIRIGSNGAELVLPHKSRKSDAGYKFLLKKESWIRQKLEYLVTQAPVNKTTIPFFGKIYSLRYIDADHTNVLVTNDTISVYSLPERQKDVLKRFLRDKLLEEIMKLVTPLQKKHNLFFTKIRIMDNKGKWGSCSSKAVLSFNWRLIFTPMEVLRYLVVHEMCHIAEMNHSRNFWNLVQKIYPGYIEAKLWLKENNHRLHQYFPAQINRQNKEDTHMRLRRELSRDASIIQTPSWS
jgi:hypothetical protein